MTTQQTNITHDQDIVRMEFSPSSGQWHRVLNILHDEGIVQALTDPAFRLFYAFLRMNDVFGPDYDHKAGLVYAPIPRLMEVVKRGRTFVYSGRSELLVHPRGLLADRGNDRFAVCPSFRWASRANPQRADDPVREVRTKSPQGADGSCVLHREARARQTNQPKTGQIDQNQGAESNANAVVGWPIGVAGIEAMADGDVYGLLMGLGVWDYMARPIAGCLHVSVERVLAMAREVMADPTAGNRGYCLGYRLAEAFGVKLPPSPAKGRITQQGIASGMEGIARMRIERMRKASVQVQHEESEQ